MPILELRTEHDPILRRFAEPVEHHADRKQLIADMFETMRAHKGIGLAAPQVGVSERILIAEVRGQRIVLINPQIETVSRHKAWNREGCLSIPGKFVGVKRPTSVTMTGYDENWSVVRLEARHQTAVVVLHEFDHLNGRLMTDMEEAGNLPESALV